MSDSKNYNRIVFLTTLSVYLGLVLVGAAPSAMAHAALTQRIEIQNQIETDDDLDKNPDEDLFALPISNLVSELSEFSQKGLFSWNSTNKFEIESLGICETDNSPSFLGIGTINRKIDEALERAAINVARRLFGKISNLGLGDLYSHTADFKFVLDNETLVLTTKINPNYHVNDKKDVQPFVDELKQYVTRVSSLSNSANNKIVAENTKITFENNQVFVITNLPRASIDALLAERVAK